MPKTTLKEFDAIFPELVNVLTSQDCEHPEPIEALQWIRQALEYNVPFGKKNRGVSTVTAYEHIMKKPTPENMKIARVIGWCVELENVGMIAINDGLLIEQAIYRLLRTYIRDQPYYRDIVELFLQSGFQTCVGQCLDTITAPPHGKVDFTEFTVEKHTAIIKWKTAFYSFYMPVAAALYMAGISDDQSHTNAKTILLKMGHFFQVQDDYLDCYGDPEVIGKIGTDIQDNKCSWLIVHALELASKQQKETLKDNYGRWDDGCVDKVKEVFRELDIQGLYRQFEDSSYQELVVLVDKLSGNLPKEIFLDYANRLYKRDK